MTIASRGNWYWDSKERVKDKVDRFIKCDRKEISDERCPELQAFINETEHFDAVYDFSAQNRHDIKDSIAMVKGKVGLYIFISTGGVYDVCNKKHDGATKETDATRYESSNTQNEYNLAHYQSHEKLEAEEALMEQRFTDDGFPFIILRFPDVFGPRDTTYRFAIYHLWFKMAMHLKEIPVRLPSFLKDFKFSLVYSEDLAQVMAKLIHFGPQVYDQAINLAYEEHFTARDFLEVMQESMDQQRGENLDYWAPNYDMNFYLYPTVRRGPMDSTKAQSLLDWKPTPVEEAVKATSDFYEEVMKGDKFSNQRDEIIQIVGHQLYKDQPEEFWSTLEKIYEINLSHFRPKDEL